MKSLFYFLISIIAILILSGCTAGMSVDFSSYDENKDYGFKVSSDSVLSSPPAGKARIYGFREDKLTGSLVRYNITMHSIKQANDGFKEGYFFGYSSPGVAFMIDIVPSGKPIIISGRTEARVSFQFTPQPDKIYCVASDVGMGFIVARPIFTLVEKEVCEYFIGEYLNDESMKQWEQDKKDFLNQNKQEFMN